jgi:hypothetical protein
LNRKLPVREKNPSSSSPWFYSKNLYRISFSLSFWWINKEIYIATATFYSSRAANGIFGNRDPSKEEMKTMTAKEAVEDCV